MSGKQVTQPTVEASGAGEAGDVPQKSPRRVRLRVLLAAAAAVVVAVAAVSAYLITRPGTSQGGLSRVSGIPEVISDSTVNMMELNALPHKAAPGFTFTDQNGRTMSLSDFRGKVVVLEFLDPHCTDICPIVSREFVDAYHDLGAKAGNVVFLGINVNQYHAGVTDVLAFSKEQQLTTIPDWHYFTGPTPALQAAWSDYHIWVQAPNPDADIVHTSAVYFIAPDGTERYLASPQVDHNASGSSYLPTDQINAWGHGIADLASTLAG